MFKTPPHPIAERETDSVFRSSSIKIEMYAINRPCYSFLCISQHCCPSIWPLKSSNAQSRLCPSHNCKHSIICSADLHTPTHHLTVNAATCYLSLFINIFLCANTRSRALGKRIGFLFHRTSQLHRACDRSNTLSTGSENLSSILQTLNHPHIRRQLSRELTSIVKKNYTMSSIIYTWLYVVLTVTTKQSLWELWK